MGKIIQKVDRHDRCYTFFYPFADALDTVEFLEKSLENPRRFVISRDSRERFFKNWLTHFFKISKEKFGQSFFIKDLNQMLPPDWNALVSHLKASGVIKNYYIRPVYNDLPKLFRVCLEWIPESTPTDSQQPFHSVFAQGVSKDFETALSQTIGEFLERLPLLIYKEKDFIKTSPRELLKKRKYIFNFSHLVKYSEKQIKKNPNLQINLDDTFLWTKAKNITRNKNVFVPAQLVFWAYRLNHKGWHEKVIREPNSNGAASAPTLKEAILRGVYELVQRDGFLIYWLNKIAPQIIDTANISHGPLRGLLDECKRYNLEVYFLNTATEFEIPSCMCVVLDHSGIGAKVCMGGGAGARWEEVLHSALSEALSVHIWLREVKDRGEEYNYVENESDLSFSKYTMNDRVKLWAHGDMFQKFSFFLKGEKIPFKNLHDLVDERTTAQKELAFIISKMKSRGDGYDVHVYQAHHSLLEKFNSYTVRVIIPQLMPMYLYEGRATLGAERLREVPRLLGYKNASVLNKWPHPFP